MPSGPQSHVYTFGRRRCAMRFIITLLLAGFSIVCFSQQTQPAQSKATEAPSGLEGVSNGVVLDVEHEACGKLFEEVENVNEGLGPLYNAQSCRECHQNPLSGGGSQITELRAGHIGSDHRFLNPNIPIAHGAEIISGRTLVSDRAICPSAAFSDTEIQERVPDSE